MSPARSPHEVIVSSIYFDYNPTANAERILANLRAEGYEVVPSGVDLPELKRIFDKGTVSFEQATYWFNRAFEMGKGSIMTNEDHYKPKSESVSVSVLREHGPLDLRTITRLTARHAGCPIMYVDVAAVLSHAEREGRVVLVADSADYRECVWQIAPAPVHGEEEKG